MGGGGREGGLILLLVKNTVLKMEFIRWLKPVSWLKHCLKRIDKTAFLELEWMLSEKGAVKTNLEEDPRKKRAVKDMMSSALKQSYRDAGDSNEDSD